MSEMRVFTLAAGVLLGTSLWGSAPVRRSNTFEIPVKEGYAELEWISRSSFRFLRTWGAPERWRKPVNPQTVEVKSVNLGPTLRLVTSYVTVEVDQDGQRLRLQGEAKPLTSAEVRRDGSALVIEGSAAAGERFYGLGPRPVGKLDVRGSSIETARPFVISSAGYGQYFPERGKYTFDLGASRPDRWRVILPGERAEFFFYYGPTPKEVLEEHLAVAGAGRELGESDFEVRKSPASLPEKVTWQSLREALYEIEHASFSAVLAASFDLSAYGRAGDLLFARAAQLGSVMPVLYASSRGLQELQSQRKRLVPYLLSYAREAWERGLPIVRPLPMQFPEDADVWKRTDVFMLGDELLIAPALNAGDKVTAYLPRGIWTDLRTDEVYKGRQEVLLNAGPGDVPMLARNGSIVPLLREGKEGLMELHYFPRLGAEFFLFEEQARDFSQFHAAPAAQFTRLEIESLRDRAYEWVVHHGGACRRVESGGVEFNRVSETSRLAPGSWYYDKSTDSIRVRVRAKAGADQIVNISF